MVRRWSIAMLLVLSSGCSAILGFHDGAPLESGPFVNEGGADAPGEASLDSATEAALDGAGNDAHDADAAVDTGVDAKVGPKQAFETPDIYNGRFDANGVVGLGGLAAGDARCMDAAQAAFPGRTFVAWLSTAAISAASRVAAGGPWYVGNAYLGMVADLTGASLQTPLDKAPDGTVVPLPIGVWTGTDEVGMPSLGCADWTAITAAANGGIGTSGGAGFNWTYAATRGCNYRYHLYCFEL